MYDELKIRDAVTWAIEIARIADAVGDYDKYRLAKRFIHEEYPNRNTRRTFKLRSMTRINNNGGTSNE